MQISDRAMVGRTGVGFRAGAAFWLRWVGATALGLVAAFALFLALFAVIGEPGDLLFPVLIAGVGLIFGACQQRVLRTALGEARRWAVMTGSGLGLGIALALITGQGTGLAGRVLAGVIHGATIGAIMGTLQWLVLRARVAGARWWVPASIVSWAAGGAAADAVGYFVDGLDIVAGPIVAAATSGLALVALLRSHLAVRAADPSLPSTVAQARPGAVHGLGEGA